MRTIILSLILSCRILSSAIPAKSEQAHNPSDAQKAVTKWTLPQALEHAAANSPFMALQKLEAQQASAHLSEARRLPNPVVSYANEHLQQNSIDLSERTVSGSLPINFLWERWSGIAAEKNRLAAEKILIDEQSRLTALAVIKSFVAFHYSTTLLEQLKTVQQELGRIVQMSAARLKSGDVSEYEHQRISLAALGLDAEIQESALLSQTTMHELLLMAGLRTDTLVTEMPACQDHPVPAREELEQAALSNRAELTALEHLIAASEMTIRHEKSRRIPAMTLGLGYKHIQPETEGAILQMDLSLPLFNRNQFAIQSGVIARDKLLTNRALLQSKIKQETAEAIGRMAIYRKQFQTAAQLFRENLLETVITSYDRGEMSLTDFINAIQAYVEALRLRTESEMKYRHSLHELELITGKKLE